MNTKLLMMASSIFMGLIGITMTFLPYEIIEFLEETPNKISTLSLQLTGALYFGFAVTNWMAKGVIIGGIYSRPLAIGNFAHFMIAGLALIKTSLNASTGSPYILILTITYVLFAILFGYLTFTHPNNAQKK